MAAKSATYAGLEAMNRDLRFFPADTAKAKTLTPQEIQHYNENGYVFPFTVFNEQEAAANRAYFDMLIDTVKAANDGRDAYSINSYQNTCRGLWDMCVHPKILDHVQDIIGPEVICWGSHFFCKMPGDMKQVGWHQDASYWPLTPSKTVTVWLAIDDADEGNGAMRVIPCTHNKGHIEFRDSTEGDNAVLGQMVDNAEQYGKPVSLSMKAGQMSLHSDMLLHGSEPNRSDRRRCGLTIRYCSPTVRGGFNTWSIWARGTDPTGHWANMPRPEGEDPRPKAHQVKK